jgi:hypothetical protein
VGRSHFFGVGEIVDVLLLIVGAFTIGWSITDVAEDLYNFADLTINAKGEADLDRAAQAFSHAVVLAGITVIMAILLRKSVKEIQVARGATLWMRCGHAIRASRELVQTPKPGGYGADPALAVTRRFRRVKARHRPSARSASLPRGRPLNRL